METSFLFNEFDSKVKRLRKLLDINKKLIDNNTTIVEEMKPSSKESNLKFEKLACNPPHVSSSTLSTVLKNHIDEIYEWNHKISSRIKRKFQPSDAACF